MPILAEREYVSPYTSPTLGVVIHVSGVVADPDGNTVTVTMNHVDGTEIFSRAATRVAVGTYEVTLTTDETSVPGEYNLVWEFEVSTVDQSMTTFIDIGEPSPYYDQQTEGVKLVIEQTYNRFEDLYDSPIGGPHLQTYIQGNFGRERMTQLAQLGLNRLNIVSQPYQSYTLATFNTTQWGALLELATYIEVLKHLRRSYVEQPDVRNASLGYLDRRDYMQRWGEILRDEQEDLKDALEIYKIAAMGLGRPSVLISGGAFGNWGPTRLPGSAVARPYYMGFF